MKVKEYIRCFHFKRQLVMCGDEDALFSQRGGRLKAETKSGEGKPTVCTFPMKDKRLMVKTDEKQVVNIR